MGSGRRRRISAGRPASGLSSGRMTSTYLGVRFAEDMDYRVPEAVSFSCGDPDAPTPSGGRINTRPFTTPPS